MRYEHNHPGDAVHIDTKKLGWIERASHQVTRVRRDSVDGAGWKYLFVAVDDHARVGFTQMKPSERSSCAVAFLRASITYFAQLGGTVRRVLTDNGPTFRSQKFAETCRQLALRHHFTRAYRPQSNGKAERYIQSALREWAYGIPYHHSSERAVMLRRWTHHYNWHRPHQGIGGLAPVSPLGPNQKQPVGALRPIRCTRHAFEHARAWYLEIGESAIRIGWPILDGGKPYFRMPGLSITKLLPRSSRNLFRRGDNYFASGGLSARCN